MGLQSVLVEGQAGYFKCDAAQMDRLDADGVAAMDNGRQCRCMGPCRFPSQDARAREREEEPFFRGDVGISAEIAGDDIPSPVLASS